MLLLFLEVAPQDIPAKCSNKLQETCLRLYNVDRNGEFDAGFLQEACGTLRMNCWSLPIESRWSIRTPTDVDCFSWAVAGEVESKP